VSAEVPLRAKEIAEQLLTLMPDFDSFDVVLHRLESIIEDLDDESAKEVMVYYDLTELRRQCRHYAATLLHIAETIDEALKAG